MKDQKSIRRIESKVPRLLEALYDTVDCPESWQEFLEQLVHSTSGRSARLLFLNGHANQVRASHKVNIDDDAHQAYVSHYVNLCPWRPELAQKIPGRLYSTYNDFSCRQPEYYKTEFFNDWALELDIHHGVCGTVYRQKQSTVQLLIQRTRQQGPFTASETQAINRLIPHIQRSLHLSDHFQAMKLEIQGLRAISDSHGLAFLLIGETSEVIFVSSSAQNIIEQTAQLSLRGNRLHINGQSVGFLLNQRMSRKDASANDRERRLRLLSAMRLKREHLPPLRILACPLHSEKPSLQLAGERSNWAVFIQDPLRATYLDQDLLRDVYGLTGAEARVAAMVAQGQDVAEIATKTGLSVNTIRTQLKQCFRKTETKRQSELTSTLLTGAIRAPWPRE
jgi:DNA-binding CsgD family transcriptional regulator